MPLDNRNLTTGTVLRARYKGKERTCEVVQTADGLRYRLDDGQEFASPSSAGKAAMGGVSCNGWRFWSINGTRKPRTPTADKPTKAKSKPVAKTPMHSPRQSAKARRGKKGKVMRSASKSDTTPTAAAHAARFRR